MADLLTTSQVQDRLQVDRTTIYRMIDAGHLPAIRVGKQWRFQAPVGRPSPTTIEMCIQISAFAVMATAARR